MRLVDEYLDYCAGRLDGLSVSKRIVYGILSDLSGRAGIGDEWDQIFDRYREEILQTLIDITDKELAGK